jgi:hypothetical protein
MWRLCGDEKASADVHPCLSLIFAEDRHGLLETSRIMWSVTLQVLTQSYRVGETKCVPYPYTVVGSK